MFMYVCTYLYIFMKHFLQGNISTLFFTILYSMQIVYMLYIFHCIRCYIYFTRYMYNIMLMIHS